jgi:cytochrome c peroxidase
MNSEWFGFLGLVSGLALLGAVSLLVLVFWELAPSAGLAGRGRYYLAAGLGLGILAFTAKVMAIALMVALPGATTDRLAAWHKSKRTTARAYPMCARAAPSPYVAYYVWQPLPATAPAPDGNKTTPAKVALGRQLFEDPALSLDRTVACASCHDVEGIAGVDGRPTSVGIGGQRGRRNAPTVWNAAFQNRLFLDGRAASLEDQAKGPPVNPIEMGMHSLDDVRQRVAASGEYRAEFRQVFGDEVTVDNIAAAIAAYERTLVADDTPYDRFVRGDKTALDAAQTRGMALFKSVGCILCHYGPNFSSASVFDGRVPYRVFPAFANRYTARYRLTEDVGRSVPRERRGLWRVPSLRNVALTAPYFHNGSVDKLEEAVRIMAAAQLGVRIPPEAREERFFYWSSADRTLWLVERRELTEHDVRDIAAFLRALSSDRLRAAGPPANGPERSAGSDHNVAFATDRAPPRI